MKTRYLLPALIAAATLSAHATASAQEAPIVKSLTIDPSHTVGTIDPMLYGQLFEHIYYSANNGVWQEMLQERSFEPEHFPGIHPRDGYFDGWFADDDKVLHSPTRYEQPIRLTTVDTDSYDIELDLNWRSYRLARRAWSGGLMDIRFAFANQASNNEPYYVRLHNPYYEVRALSVGQTEEMRRNEELAKARQQAVKAETAPYFAIAQMQQKEIEFRGMKRTVNSLEPIAKQVANAKQINEEQQWHHVKISVRGKSVKLYYDNKQVLSYSKLETAQSNDITLWVNYTEALYRNISVTAAGGKKTLFEGLPADVAIPNVAPQWKSLGEGQFELVKGDAVNMNYSQKITASQQLAGIEQGPVARIIPGERYLGYIHAKGNGKLTIALSNGDQIIAHQKIGPLTQEWQKYPFSLSTDSYTGDADFAICVEEGTVQVDEASLTTASGQALGGFRPDIFNAVQKLHPTCMRWPGGGYVAQYDWQWGIGPQEQRRRWDHWMWMDYDQNCFGTDEFIRFCREVNSEPVLVVSVRFERPESEADEILENALNWLRYCNEPATTEWGAKRAANGHPEPYNVHYWEIDNEMWEMGIEKYEACVRRYSEAMRQIDPSIKIIACGGFQEDEQFIERSGNYFDYLSLHHYERQEGYATGVQNLSKLFDRYAEMIAKGPNPYIKLFISEWNLNSQDWRTGLFAGGFLNMCESKDVVAMGAAALFIRRTDAPDWNNAFINFDYKDLYVAPNYQVTELWYDHFSSRLIDQQGDTGELNVVTTRSEDGRHVIVKVVNPTDQPYQLNLKGSWKSLTPADYQFYAPGDLLIGNTLEHKDAVALQQSTLDPTGSDYQLNVAPYSAGVLTIEM